MPAQLAAGRAAALDRLLRDLVSSGTASAAVGLVGRVGSDGHDASVEWEGAAGLARPGVAAGAGTLFDFGSLNKPFVATLALTLDAGGELALSAPVGALMPARGARARALARRPLSDLLRHRSGLAAWTPLYHRCATSGEVESLLAGGALLGTRAGTYSDLDYLLWARLAERRCGEPLAALLRRRVLAPLELEAVVAAPGERTDVALSHCDTGREVELAARQGLAVAPLGPPPAGLPLDGNARFLLALGWGLPGHGGLFGRARDLWRLGTEWLAPRRLLQADGVASALAGGGPFALGWWRRRVKGGGGGPALAPAAFGHTGFPGGNLWIDPVARRVLVLLAHREDPASKMNHWRRRFHAVAMK
jgi:CubicO group peptidase (beta-lactamase class C family)